MNFVQTAEFDMATKMINSRKNIKTSSIYLYILQHPLARIMCSCMHQKKQSVIKAAYSGPERIQVQGHDNLGREFVPLYDY